MLKFVSYLGLVAMLSACAAPTPDASAGGQAGTAGAGEGLAVVAAVYPLGWLAEQVAPAAELTLLNVSGNAAHDIEISPGQRAAVETADAVMFMGHIGYQPQVEQAVESATGEVVDVAAIAGEQRLLEAAGGVGDAEEETDAEGPPGAAEPVDPHIWFNMSVMSDTVLQLGQALAAQDPAGAEAYRGNAARVAEQLGDLDRDLADLLGGDCAFDEVLVSHLAYNYLIEPHDKQLRGITGTESEAGASVAALAELVELIRREGLRYVLAEPVEGRADAEALAREAGIDVLDIYPLDAVAPEDAAKGFPQLVREQAEAFATAYECG